MSALMQELIHNNSNISNINRLERVENKYKNVNYFTVIGLIAKLWSHVY